MSEKPQDRQPCPECAQPCTRDAQGNVQRHEKGGGMGCALGWENQAPAEQLSGKVVCDLNGDPHALNLEGNAECRNPRPAQPQAPAPSLDARGDLSDEEIAELSAHAATSHDADGCSCDYAHLFPRLIAEVKRRRAAPSAPSDALRRASEWLEAIQVRCREGDPKCNWLPKIDEFATNALSELMHVAATAVPSDALRKSLGELIAEWATQIMACHKREEEAKTLGVQHCESYNQGQRYVYGSCAKAVSAALAASPSVTREQEWRSPECNYQLREILTLAWDHVNPIAAKFRKDILAAREHFAPLPAPTAPKEPQR